MSDEDVRSRFAALTEVLQPLDGATQQILRATQRRRRRPFVAVGALATATLVITALAMLSGTPDHDGVCCGDARVSLLDGG